MPQEKPKKILIVEDDNFLISVYSKKFSAEGYEVFQVMDGQKAFNIIKEKSPDLILLDIMLPGINGLEILKQIQENEQTKKIPVIMLTNVSEKSEIDRAFSLGAKDYIIKTFFTPAEVLEKIKKHI